MLKGDYLRAAPLQSMSLTQIHNIPLVVRHILNYRVGVWRPLTLHIAPPPARPDAHPITQLLINHLMGND